jgi:hypothetical protein
MSKDGRSAAMSGMSLSPPPAVPRVLTDSRPSQRSALAPWAALQVPHLHCPPLPAMTSLGLGSHRRRATPGKPSPPAACAYPVPPEIGSRKYLQFSVLQASRVDSMIRPLRARAVMLGLGRRDGRRQRCQRRGRSSSCHRFWEAPARLGSCLMPSRQRCLESEEFADAVGASVKHYIYRDLGVSIRAAGRPAPRAPGSGFIAGQPGRAGRVGGAGSRPARRVRQRPAVRRNDS